MSTDLAAQLAAILQAVEIHSPSSFSFAGEPPVEVRPSQTQTPPLAQGSFASPLAAALSGVLYQRAYAQPFGQPGSNWELPLAHGTSASFIERLSQANGSRERWDSGWQVTQTLSNAQLQIQKGEALRTALPGEYLLSPPGQPRIGQPVTLHVRRESRDFQPGFYFCFGETLSDHYDDYDLLRLYFNSPAAAAPELIAALSGALNRFEIPFRLKCLTTLEHYTRTDSMVLYFAKRFFSIVSLLIATAPVSVLGQLNSATPLFTKPLRPGIGFAEEPGNGESFGTHRCRLLADGLIESWTRKENSASAKLEAVRRRFVAEGLNLDSPYLNAGSADFFELPAEIAITI